MRAVQKWILCECYRVLSLDALHENTMVYWDQAQKLRIRGTQSFSRSGKSKRAIICTGRDDYLFRYISDTKSNGFSTIKVLRDAAASALYGIKAANGVIEITSKKGYKRQAHYQP